MPINYDTEHPKLLKKFQELQAETQIKQREIEELEEEVQRERSYQKEWADENRYLTRQLDETEAALRDLWFSDLDNFCADFWLDDHPEHRAAIERLTQEGEK